MVAANTTKKTEIPTVDFDAAAERIRTLNEQVIDQAKKQGNASLDAWEKALQTVVDFEKKATDASQLDFVKALTDAQEFGEVVRAAGAELVLHPRAQLGEHLVGHVGG